MQAMSVDVLSSPAMSRPEPLSVTVITLNEERDLERCLESVAWADEIIVVDSGSTDRTCEIARACGARVLPRAWTGNDDQKNHAIDRARHRWILSLDADEWLTPEGVAEVREVLTNLQAVGYAFNRHSSFCGEFLKRTWNPDWQLRLFDRRQGRFAGGKVHESVAMGLRGRVLRMSERLPHMAYRTVNEYVERINRYTGLAAETLAERGRRTSWIRLLFAPPATFLKMLVVKGGVRDGGRGLVVAAGSAFYVALKYIKLWGRTRNDQR
jgi:glycosyltransferase involved in cell wall biosynthesis